MTEKALVLNNRGRRIIAYTRTRIMTIIVRQMLSNLFLDVVLFRYDNLTKEVYILASNDIQIKIPSNGKWEFLND
jgi:hypothetical protein